MNLPTRKIATYAGAVLLAIASQQSSAQHELSSFTSTGRGVASPFVTDYHALGINASNLDWTPEYEDKMVTFGFAEIAGSVYSEALIKDDLRKNLFGGDFENLTQAQKIDMIKNFTDAGTSIDLNYMWAGAHVQTGSFGGFAYTTRDNFSFRSQLSEEVATLLYLGGTAPYFDQLILNNGDTIPNMEGISQDTLDMVAEGITSLANAKSFSEILGNSEVSLTWIREYSIGYGKRVLKNDAFELYAGAGFKYLVGQGMVQLGTNADGQIESFSALSPVFNIDYGSGAETNPSQLPESARNMTPVGQGFGFDVGASMVIKEKLFVALSLTDIGRMTWDGNVYKLNDFDVTSLTNNGLETNSILDQLETLTDPDGLLQWEGSTKVTTKLPSKLRAGARFDIGDKLRIGAEGVFATNDELSQLDKPLLAFGGDVTPFPWIRLSVGLINGGNYDFKVPAGLTLIVGGGTWEVGVASRDMITFFTENQPTISASFGFLRFRV
ncbi:MAG: hypothetical protein KDC12_03000 [Flavobacteriales bacterium]|nr:hypothetical protein [Flavobacteriales bacterium]